MSGPVIRGWCPGAHRPMLSGDGLVVRVRPPLGQLTPRQALGLADLAEAHGNGVIELTSRANLQLRGVAPLAHAPLLDGLWGLGLIPAEAATEGRAAVVLDPFRSGDTANEIAAQLMQGLSDARFAVLPSKFGFALDCGPLRQLADISADIRIEAAGPGLIVRADGWPTGRAVASGNEAVGAALELADWFIASGGVGTDGRGRMARHLTAGACLPDQLRGRHRPNPWAPASIPGRQHGGLCLATAFGLLDAEDLRTLAQSGAALLRVTPWRMIFLPQLNDFAPQSGGIICGSDDPILRVWACTGAPGCVQAHAQTRGLARTLASRIGEGDKLHVSGCAKGCAHPGPATITLVGRNGCFDLIRNGTAQDTPQLHGLTPDQIQTMFGG